MMLKDVIIEATSEYDVFFLLTSYIEALRYADRLDTLPRYLKSMPLRGVDDVAERLEEICKELAKPTEFSKNGGRDIIEEAVGIFGAASSRLQRIPSRTEAVA